MSNSPDVLENSGVKRLNKRPLMIVAGIGVFIMFSLLYAVNRRAEAQREKKPTDPQAEQQHTVQTTDATVRDLTKNFPEAGDIPAGTKTPAGQATPATPPAKLFDAAGAALIPPAGPAPTLGAAPAAQQPGQLTAQQKAEEEWLTQYRAAQQRKWQLYEAAIAAPSRVATNSNQTQATGSAASAQLVGQLGELAARRAAVEGRQASMMRAASSLASGAGGSAGQDPNMQDNKIAFADAERNGGYLQATRVAPVSPYEVSMGTVIPAVMISGVNSDLPGELIAQVSQDVWDTATGRILLIPQGAKLFGVYDSRVAFGQNRVLVAWTRITYPDNSTLDLGGMSGADQAGYAGFKDKVNNHYLRIFGSAILMSSISAGVLLATPDDGQSFVQSNKEKASEQFAADMASITRNVVQKNLNVQPTIIIRPGLRFNVMVSKAIIFPGPYDRQ
jgi:type IV secretion system protein VirB10